MRNIPMGWSGAVDVMQALLRRLVYVEADIPVSAEVRARGPFPQSPNLSVTYIAGFDWLRLCSKKAENIINGVASKELTRFLAVCKKLNIPENIG